ncbi:9.7 kDa protein [Lymantria xylina nucleopolyhedrovirus]|uniref:9.7 kDa protein n=1 Tax=Lymantria xylina multiple nucleopolyhedrovirus TaxID=2847840 RepID=D4N2F6_9ABAC|nr:9.7 kDa protein [Lymantria xylina nucleopolyhedrovirus]ADD73828.1 9.7 kDa protein [Lymantria xylina nucleopolyhedrovirus]
MINELCADAALGRHEARRDRELRTLQSQLYEVCRRSGVSDSFCSSLMTTPVGGGHGAPKSHFKDCVDANCVQSSMRRNDVLVVPARNA